MTATAALEHFWADEHLTDALDHKAPIARARLARIAQASGATVRGRGLILGLAFSNPQIAQQASRHAFEHGLVIETAGAESQVLKLLPPLTIPLDELERGLDIIERAVAHATQQPRQEPGPKPRPSHLHLYPEVAS